jgi:hypothetical protein
MMLPPKRDLQFCMRFMDTINYYRFWYVWIYEMVKRLWCIMIYCSKQVYILRQGLGKLTAESDVRLAILWFKFRYASNKELKYQQSS